MEGRMAYQVRWCVDREGLLKRLAVEKLRRES